MLVLFLPAVPLLFMGQEWAASSPFLFFTDHDQELGEAIRRGRSYELRSFAAFSTDPNGARVPDPQARATFERSKLRWDEREREPHAGALALHRAMLALRRQDPVLRARCAWNDLEAFADGDVLYVTRRSGEAVRLLVVNFGTGAHVPRRAQGSLLLASGPCDGQSVGAATAALFASER
jgi:maltooligosyltrehalose trehalohydrolase